MSESPIGLHPRSVSSISCSGVLFIQEYSLVRKFSAADIQKVARAAHDYNFIEEEPKKWVKEEGVTDFLSMRLHADGKSLDFGSCLLPGPTLYVYPGPDRWTKSKEKEVDAIISNLEDNGLKLQLMRPGFRDLPRSTNAEVKQVTAPNP